MNIAPLLTGAATLLMALNAPGQGEPPRPVAGGRSIGAEKAAGLGSYVWPSWRGPGQFGASEERNLPESWQVDGENHLWTYPVRGRGTPVIANGRVYVLGYSDEGADLVELLLCLDEQSGKLIWQHAFSDFISDTVYDRYSIGSPTVDPQTGNVYCLTSPGLLCCFTGDGELKWQISMMEVFGRLTFPNGRTGAPAIEGDLVIVHPITSMWGPAGPAMDRFYAFDKRTGELVWWSQPGASPKDNSMSMPVFQWLNGRRVLYATTGCGYLVCLDARTGQLMWRYFMTNGGMNASVLLYRDMAIAIHGTENIDASNIGRMIAVRTGSEPSADATQPNTLSREHEVWRNDLESFSSSPVLVGNRIYQTIRTGELCAVNADNGQVLWHEKLAPDQIHASPAWGDGKLYVPMNNGMFYIIRPTDEGPQRLAEVQLPGNCLGAPAIANGKVFVHTTEALYCFGTHRPHTAASMAAAPILQRGEPAILQVIPADVICRPGETVTFRAQMLDARGNIVDDLVRDLRWTPSPAVQATFDRSTRVMSIPADARPGAAALEVTSGGLKASVRVRVVPGVPFTQDFEGIALTQSDPADATVKFSWPPSEWIGGRPKWDIREVDGSKVAARTLDNPLFQRTMTFIGHPDSTNYTMQADVMSDGNRRTISAPGLIHQRYLIVLKGNYQELEVSSNVERIKQSVPFAMKPNVWYTLKSRVETGRDGSATVRAKAWPRGEPEPDGWLIEVHHKHGHQNGAPGLYGFTLQSRFKAYIDNIVVTPNQ